MLCQLCESLDIIDLIRALSQKETKEITHHRSWQALCDAVGQGCQLCALFKRALQNAYADTDNRFSGLPIDELHVYHQQKDSELETHFQISTAVSGLGLCYDRQYNNFLHRADLTDEERGRTRRFPDGLAMRPFLRLSVPDDAMSAAMPIPSRMYSAQVNLDLCLQWLRKCAHEHDECSAIVDQELPTRLIDVGIEGGSEPKLVETRGMKGRYITLSHCWGTSKPPVTDAISFNKYLDCIPLASLPRTFQDAIFVVRKLGFQYLWIDCFCIIQGNMEDWRHECANMHNTFAKSSLTICGPGAGNTTEGFLHPRPMSAIPPCRLTVTPELEGGSIDLWLELVDPGACATYGLPRVEQSSPLSTRAWIVQERFLSPRTLYFGTSQMYLECRTERTWEVIRTANVTVMDVDRRSKRDIHFTEDTKKNLDIWYNLVELYSKRSLTNESDRLPALSGLASRMHHLSNLTYLAGLWDEDMFQGLHWHVVIWNGGSFDPKSADPALHKPPSWSWASCDREISFYTKGGRSKVDSQDLRIIESFARSTDQNPFGEVLSSRLVVHGRLKKASVRRRQQEKPDDFWIQHAGEPTTDFYIVTDETNENEIAGLFIDDGSGEILKHCDTQCYEDIWCLLLGFHHIPPVEGGLSDALMFNVQTKYWTAVALVPIGSNVFRRVGFIVSRNFSDDASFGFGDPEQLSTVSRLKREAELWFQDSVAKEVSII